MKYEEFFKKEDATIEDVRDILLEHMLKVEREYWTGDEYTRLNQNTRAVCNALKRALLLLYHYNEGCISIGDLASCVASERFRNRHNSYGEIMRQVLEMVRHLITGGVTGDEETNPS